VPVIYSIFVLDLKIIRWETAARSEAPAVSTAYPTEPSHA